MSSKRSIISIVLIITLTFFAIIRLPSYYRHFYQIGAGREYLEILSSNNLSWDTMTESERAPYLSLTESKGIKCALFVVLGSYIPLYLLLLITIGLLSKSINYRHRIYLRFSFIGVWIIGLVFLAIGSGYYGEAIPFPESLGPAFIIYLIGAMLFGVFIWIIKFIRQKNTNTHSTLSKKEVYTPQNLNVSDILPLEITCPNCNAILELDDEERMKKKVICPACNFNIFK